MSEPEPELRPDAAPPTGRRKLSQSKTAKESRARRRKAAASKKTTTPRRSPVTNNRSLEGPIRETLIAIGTVWGTTESFRDHPDPTCGEVLMDQAPQIAKALNIVAQDDPSVYLWLDRMLTGGGWGSVAFAVLPVAQAFAGAHIVPALQRRQRAAMEGTFEVAEPSPGVEVNEAGGGSAPYEPPTVIHGPDFAEGEDLGPGFSA